MNQDIVLNIFEADARRKLAPSQPIFDSHPARVIREAFWSSYGAALPIERIQRIGCALLDCPEDLDLQPALTLLVRAGVLRSRISQGVRLYELDYAN